MGILGLIGTLGNTIVNSQMTNQMNKENAKLNNLYWQQQAQESYRLNEKAADNAMKRTIKIYNELQSPSAMVEQLKSAGLNPALMYSNGGIGGHMSSGQQGGTNASAQGAPILGLQKFFDPMTLAQLENIQADTRKKESETEKTKWDAELTKWNSYIAELDNKLKEEIYYINYAKAYKELQILTGNAESALAQGYIDEETKEQQIKLATAELANRQWQTELLKSQKNLNEEQQNKLKIDVIKMGQEIQNLILEGELTEKKIWEINQKYGWNFNKEDLKYSINSILDFVKNFIPSIKIN